MRTNTSHASKTTLHSLLWADQDAWRLWSWCVLSVAHKARTTLIDMIPVRLAAGQIAAPLEVICTQTGLRPEAIRKALTIGKKLGIYAVRASPWGLHITIVDWQEVSRRTPAPFQ